ncbi:MAG: hypothetical protein IH991_03315 [Planctomycetes bacterium]|nr:hypothetical protein [Planctomycetota bacterium]
MTRQTTKSKPIPTSSTCATCKSLRMQLAASNDLLASKNRSLAKTNETFHRLIDRVAHHLRTPLTVIKQFAALMDDGLAGPLSEQQQEFLGTILMRSDDLAFALDDLLDIGRLDAGALRTYRQRCRVEDLLEHAKLFLVRRAQTKNVTFRVHAPKPLPIVYCDQDKAQRAILNLVVNAFSFIPERGEVDLWARHDEESNCVIVGVTDNGPAIAQRDLDALFSRFDNESVRLATCDPSSTMGLANAKTLIQLNLGTMHATSGKEGNTFWFTLPVDEPRALLSCFLEQLQGLKRNGDYSVLSVQLEDDAAFSASPVLDEFLQGALPTSDLVYQFDSAHWLIVASCSVHELDDLLDGLAAAWSERKITSPIGSLPDPKIVPVGTWQLPNGYPRLASAFLSVGKLGTLSNAYRNVLLVDDDPEVIENFSGRLEAAGYDIVVTRDGDRGVATATSRHPDAVVLDVRAGYTSIDSSQWIDDIVANVRQQQKALQIDARFITGS